jgi:hypothetical protein
MLAEDSDSLARDVQNALRAARVDGNVGKVRTETWP